MSGTRVGVLNRLIEWVLNDPKGIFWLVGMAGTGKTSIAVTLCRMLQKNPDVLLGGTFFCSRTASNKARSKVRSIIPTLVMLLANRSTAFAAGVVAEPKPDSDATVDRPPKEQFRTLLQGPLAALASQEHPVVFVIDALDETNEEPELTALLSTIATFSKRSPARVKFILTSRPETPFLKSPVSERSQSDILHLHRIDPDVVAEDIRFYINQTFAQNLLYDDPEDWYSDSDVRALADASNGLFIFASTAVGYILDTYNADYRRERLSMVLSARKDSKVLTAPLDNMYELVFTQALITAKLEPHERETTRQALACILAARMPLSVDALAELLGLKADVLKGSLSRLHPVIHVPDMLDRPGLQVMHSSLGDYLFERATPNIRISSSLGNALLARGCLKVMEDKLRFNIAQSRSSYEANPPTRPESITLSLEYACLQWVYHVSNLPEGSDFDSVINDAFRCRFLFWLEVMSIIGQVQRAAAMLNIAVSIVSLSA